ncbi:MAG: DUF6119 family protein [Anaerolineae bacterium]|jgi:uncharacterized protein (TIGR04141 family)
MKLSIYLLREEVTDLSKVILERQTSTGSYVQVSPARKLPFACCAWLQQNKPKPPQWVGWLSEAFDLTAESLINQSNSFVLGLSVAGRSFAITFGYGFAAIDRALVVPDFGLKVTLSTVDPQALDTMDTRTLDRVTKLTRTHLNVGRPAEEFGIEPNLDWLRSVRGSAKGDQITGKVEGSDAVKVTWKSGIETLGECCDTLLQLYESGDYRQHFGFVDHLRRLPDVDPLVRTLETKVLQLLCERNQELLTLAHPDVPSPEVDTYKIWYGHTKRKDIEELDLAALYAFMDEYRQKTGEDPDPHKTWVIALDTQGEAKTQKTALWRYLVGHIEHDGHIYVLSLEQWYRTDRDYLAELRAKVSRIEDATAILDLPSWPKNQNEEAYNRQVAEQRNWLLFDRKMFTFGSPTDKIECADLLTPDRDFIHVKSMTSSATLSHLFSQGTVSARLLRTTDEYRHRVEAEYRSRYGKGFDTQSGSRVVYAIATAKEGSVSESLFFFSLVNLVLHQEMLASMGLPVAVCRIRREAS